MILLKNPKNASTRRFSKDERRVFQQSQDLILTPTLDAFEELS